MYGGLHLCCAAWVVACRHEDVHGRPSRTGSRADLEVVPHEAFETQQSRRIGVDDRFVQDAQAVGDLHARRAGIEDVPGSEVFDCANLTDRSTGRVIAQTPTRPSRPITARRQ